MNDEREFITKLLNGKGIGQDIQDDLRVKVMGSRVKPGLGVILVGYDPASKMYVKFKTKASQEVGMFVDTVELPEDVKEKKILKIIDKFNNSKRIHGILIQLPLPKHLNASMITSRIDPQKDVDGLTSSSHGRVALNHPGFMPATVKGILRLVEETGYKMQGAEVVVVNSSNLIGKPLAQALINKGATVTVTHEHTRDLAYHTRRADVIITAVGKQHLITGDMVREGVVVIDAGISKDEEGKTVGDVEFDAVKEKAAYLTPVPGGVGPMTVASLLQNTWQSMRWMEGYDESPFKKKK